MAEISIIVEGEADRKFLKDYISHLYSIDLSDEHFIIVGGNEGKINLVQNTIRASTEQGKNNLLIFDADQTNYRSTLEDIEGRRDEFGLEFEIFLFPNNADDGNLETLLKSIIKNTNLGVLNCIDSYSDCIEEMDLQNLRDIDDKAKLYIYVDSFTIGGSGAESRRDYFESRLWDLNSHSLNNLKSFLDKYFKAND